MAGYVAYTNGLLATESSPDGLAPGDTVSKGDFDDEEWAYHVLHGNVVRAGGPHDPNVLAAASEPEEVSEDPKEQRIRALEQQLEMYQGQQQTRNYEVHPESHEAEEEASGVKKEGTAHAGQSRSQPRNQPPTK